MELGISGLASGFDWRSLVDQLMEVERAPQKRLLVEQSAVEQKSTSYGGLKTQLSVLQNRAASLSAPELFARRTTTVDSVGDDEVATATAANGSAIGSYKFEITQLASASVRQGLTNIGAAINPTNDVSALVLSDAGFPTAVTAGSFSVNGKSIDLSTSDSLQDVFDKISSATSGAVTGAYDSLTDKITLSGAGEIVLGSSKDSSNFLTVAKLHNNGTSTVGSSSSLGGVKTSASLNAGNFSTAISDGGSGAGEFKINGVSISFDAGSDSLKNVIDRINLSGAGVTASYDPVNDRLSLTNTVTGDLGVGIEDVTGNFLAATGLSGGTLSRGKNLEYSINGGGTLISNSNTITEPSSGITGLAVTALKIGVTQVEVKSDTGAVKSAINGFITEYNKIQAMIDKETASSTDDKGKVTAGTLAGQSDANEIASKLRAAVFSEVGGLTGAVKRLAHLGIDTNGDNNNLKLGDGEALDNALLNDMSGVAALFTDPTNGLATRLKTYLEKTAGDDGELETRIANLANQSVGIDKNVAEMERRVQANRDLMILTFVQMETAQSNINNQLAQLQKSLAGIGA